MRLLRISRIGLCLLALAAGACEVKVSRRVERRSAPGPRPAPVPGIELPQADQRLCTAVVILLDSSSSMLQTVRDRDGKQRAKHQIAREALERIIDHTEEWKTTHADTNLELGLYHFSSSVSELAAVGPFDAARVRASLSRVAPSSGTAIGRALETAFKALYATGCVRKHILCITDGDNTSGPSPERVARAYHEATGGEVAIQFVAFDTGAKKFRFLADVNGRAVEAADGGELEAQLTEIYEKRILAEAMPAEKE